MDLEKKDWIRTSTVVPKHYVAWIKHEVGSFAKSELIRKALEFYAQEKYKVNLLTWKKED